MNKLFFVFAMIAFSSFTYAQENVKFSVEVSNDSILMGNYFKVKFSLENAKGDQFVAPIFEGFNVISGPNFSSSMSIMNGEMSQSVSYTYYLEPKDIGNFYIQPASINVGEDVLETQPLEVMVVPNPDGIKQKIEEPNQYGNRFKDFWGPRFKEFRSPRMQPKDKLEKEKEPKKKKKKRKIYKM